MPLALYRSGAVQRLWRYMTPLLWSTVAGAAGAAKPSISTAASTRHAPLWVVYKQFPMGQCGDRPLKRTATLPKRASVEPQLGGL